MSESLDSTPNSMPGSPFPASTDREAVDEGSSDGLPAHPMEDLNSVPDSHFGTDWPTGGHFRSEQLDGSPFSFFVSQ